MTAPLTQHQAEIERNLRAWNDKPLLRNIYAGFYQRILALIDPAIPGRIVEIGSGIGNLKAHLPARGGDRPVSKPVAGLGLRRLRAALPVGEPLAPGAVRRVPSSPRAECLSARGAAGAGACRAADSVRALY